MGKTTLTQRLITGHFNPSTKMTIGVGLQIYRTMINSNRENEDGEKNTIPILTQIWDFGGEDRFRFLLPSYCKGAVGALLLYDLSRFSTAIKIAEWVSLWNKYALPNAPLFLIGSKLDMIPEKELQSTETSMFSLANDLKISNKMMISSKTGSNVLSMISQFLIEVYNFNLDLFDH